MHEKSTSQTGGWCVELEEVWMLKGVKLWWEHMDIAAEQGKVVMVALVT